MSTGSTQTEGSWTPTIILFLACFMLWLSFGSSKQPKSFRRFMNMQRLKWRKKLGLRDDSKYKMKAGDGANQKYARQG